MEQCLRVLEQIQPATREEWKQACYDDEVETCKKLNVDYSPCDFDVGIQQCIRAGCASIEYPSDQWRPTTTAHIDAEVFRLAGPHDRVFARYAEADERQRIEGMRDDVKRYDEKHPVLKGSP